MTFVEVPDKDQARIIEAMAKGLCVACNNWVGVERRADGLLYCAQCDDDMPDPELELGQPVRFEHSVARIRSRSGQFLGPERIWTSVISGDGRSAGQRTPAGQGIVVGKRTISDGDTHGGYDEWTEYTPFQHYTAWLVAYDLRRKPLHVLSRHIEALPVQLELGQ